MNTPAFQKKVLGYSHLPEVFLKELARVADLIPEKQQDEIVAELDKSAEHEVQIISDGYKVIADAEKKMRKEVEAGEHAKEQSDANAILTNTSSPSL